MTLILLTAQRSLLKFIFTALLALSPLLSTIVFGQVNPPVVDYIQTKK